MSTAPPPHPWAERARRFGLPLALLAGAVLFGAVLHGHYPIDQWLFWRYARAWLLAILFGVSCLSAGFALLDRGLPRLPLREKLLFGFAAGLYLFYAALFVGGVLGLYGPVFALALPVSFLAAGALPLTRALRRARSRLRSRRDLVAPRRSASWYAIAAFGAMSVGMVYFATLSPQNASFDTVWYHLGLGQQFLAQGGIQRSPEGWFVAALPQLAAVLYGWAFLLPGGTLFDTVELAAHLEVVIFLATLPGLPLLVRWLVPGRHAGLSWVALFLFPAIFVYDAGLVIGADHIAAFWAIPIFLALRRAWARLDARYMALLALCLAGALLTKYQAASLLAAPALAVLGRAGWLAWKREPAAPWLRGLAVGLVVGLALTSPHWLKNWVWYGDPLYPALHKHLTLEPWNPDINSAIDANWSRLVWRPKGPFRAQLQETFLAGFQFSFRSEARKQFHGALPVFGSLFTLSLLWLPFLRRSRRTWLLFLAAQLGVWVWYYLSHVERYLQALVPWMAAVVAAVVILAWRQGLVARVAVCLVVGLQVIWGGDAYFYPTHAMMNDAPVRVVSKLLATGYAKDFKARERIGGSLQTIGDRLPEGSTVLLHEHNPRLGLGTAVVTDMPGFQGLISYGRLGSARELHELLTGLQVTHLVWRSRESRALDSLGGDLRFFGYVARHGRESRREGSLSVARVAAAPPEETGPELAAYLGCGKVYQRGLHPLSALTVLAGAKQRHAIEALRPIPEEPAGLAAAIAEAGYVVYDPNCKGRITQDVFRGFVQIASRKTEQLWIRSSAAPVAGPGAGPGPGERPVADAPVLPLPPDELEDGPGREEADP